MNATVARVRTRSVLDIPQPTWSSPGTTADSILTGKRLANMRRLLSAPVEQLKNATNAPATGDLASQLRMKLAALKRLSGPVSMYLDRDYRQRLFARLDELLDPLEWEPSFGLPSEQSFSTFLRMIIYLHPTKRPSIGLAANGSFLCAWRDNSDRLTIECLANDEVRWSLSRIIAGDRELAAGRAQIHRIPDVTEAYNPEPFFSNGHRLLA